MDAILSTCKTYRYTLSRFSLAGKGSVCWILLNPSTADAQKDDPTIRRCIRFAQRWGYSDIHVVNLFAFRSANPHDLKYAIDPVGPENNRYILEVAKGCDRVILGWGNHGRLYGRDKVTIDLLKNAGVLMYALGLTKLNNPKHPLYLKSDSLPFLFNP